MADLRTAAQQALEDLTGVLCDPDGRCCIDGSSEDRAIVDRALSKIRAALAEQEPVADKVKAQAFDALSRMSSFRPMKDGRHPRVVLHAFIRLASPPARQPLTDDQRGGLVMEHLGPAALTGGTMSVYDAFLAGLSAAERAHGITGENK